MAEKRKPGASILRTALGVLTEQGAVVFPPEWDEEYAITELNVWLRTSLKQAKLVRHSSFALEGLVGAKVCAAVLRPLDDSKLPRARRSLEEKESAVYNRKGRPKS